MPAAPLPAATLASPTLTNKGVQWTERAAGKVGYSWAAEVGNPNGAEISAEVVLTLHDAAGEAIVTDRHPLVVAAADSAAFTDHGEIEVAVASQGTRWTFEVEMPEEGTAAGSPGVSPSRASLGPGVPAASRPSPSAEPVPLTEEMNPPELRPETAAIELEDAELQDLDLKGKVITLRCLVRADGTVAEAMVYRISPPVSLEAAATKLEDAVERSAMAYWRFRPATRPDGQAVAVWHTLTIRYEPGG